MAGKRIWIFVAFAAASSAVFGATSDTNPITGKEEQVYTESAPSGTEVYWQEASGSTWEAPVQLTSNSVDDLSPRLCIGDLTGRSFVVWYRDISSPVIFLRWRNPNTGNWSDEIALSSLSDDSRSPDCATFQGDFYAVYEKRIGDQRQLFASSVSFDCPGPGCPPIPVFIRSTTLTSSPLARIHAQGAHLWIDWIDTTTEMAYSEYCATSGTWGTVIVVPIQTDIDATRAVIQSEVTGN